MAKRPTTAKGKSTALPASGGDKRPAEAVPAAEDANATESAGVREPPRRSRAALWIGAAVIIAGAGFLVWARMAMPPAEPPAGDPASVALEARLDGFDDRLAALAGDMGRRLDAAEARIGELESGADAAPDGAALALDLAAVADRIDDVGATLANLDGRIAAVETAISALADAAPQDAAVALDLAAIEARLAALESAPGTAPAAVLDDSAMAAVEDEAARLAALADELARRLAVLEARPIAAGAEAGALLAVAQLRAALARSGTFEAELAALRTIAGEDDPEIREALAALAPRAAAGIPTLAMLRARFAGLADGVVRAAYAPPEGGWLERTFARLSELVTVRPIGDDVAGATPAAIVARAEARLAAGDLAAAVAEVGALDGAPGALVADWLGDAQARLGAERALAILDSRAVAALAGG